jgi:hypothetical protein
MAREGAPLIVIQRQLGNSNLGITSVCLQGGQTTLVSDSNPNWLDLTPVPGVAPVPPRRRLIPRYDGPRRGRQPLRRGRQLRPCGR